MPWSDGRRDIISLGGGVFLTLLLMLAFRDRPEPRATVVPGPMPEFRPASASLRIGDTLVVRSVSGAGMDLSVGPDEAFEQVGDMVRIVAEADERAAARILSIPISLNWRHPLRGSPVAQVVRARERLGPDRIGPEALHTIVFADHGALPVLSLVLPHGALFDPDSGLMVVGNAIFDAPEKVLKLEYTDPRWWKYPGNFHMRGKEWERRGLVQLIDSAGGEWFHSSVAVRINGQMTRAFPQHALRLEFPDPVPGDVIGGGHGAGIEGLVVRSAGNDQIKAMMRDAFQHELCDGSRFEVSGHRTVVLYLNGAYWGVHHLRHRMDDGEIARRYGIDRKEITILEDEARYYRGDPEEVDAFLRLVDRTHRWNGRDRAWGDTLAARLEVEGFLEYMASQMILGNMDWPEQNVKFWRFTGVPRSERPLDGRWYFIMGDSDLGYGINGQSGTDMFVRVNAVDVPITRLFHGMMRNDMLRQRFVDLARELARSRFSATRSLDHLERFVDRMAPEMERHTARWRRPASVDAWREQVDVMRRFASAREAEVLRQLSAFEQRRD